MTHYWFEHDNYNLNEYNVTYLTSQKVNEGFKKIVSQNEKQSQI